MLINHHLSKLAKRTALDRHLTLGIVLILIE